MNTKSKIEQVLSPLGMAPTALGWLGKRALSIPYKPLDNYIRRRYQEREQHIADSRAEEVIADLKTRNDLDERRQLVGKLVLEEIGTQIAHGEPEDIRCAMDRAAQNLLAHDFHLAEVAELLVEPAPILWLEDL